MRPTDQQSAAYAALVNEGSNLFDKGDFEAAMVAYWQAFRLRPGAPILLFNLARTMEELKDPRAEDFYAAAGAQGNVDAFYQLATRCVVSERTDEAVGYLQAYLRGNPAEDDCTVWARMILQKLLPRHHQGISLVWKNPSNDKKIVENDSQKQVKFGIL